MLLSELTSNSSSVRLDGDESGSYHDADSSKTTSRLTRTAWVEGLTALVSLLLGRVSYEDTFL